MCTRTELSIICDPFYHCTSVKTYLTCLHLVCQLSMSMADTSTTTPPPHPPKKKKKKKKKKAGDFHKLHNKPLILSVYYSVLPFLDWSLWYCHLRNLRYRMLLWCLPYCCFCLLSRWINSIKMCLWRTIVWSKYAQDHVSMQYHVCGKYVHCLRNVIWTNVFAIPRFDHLLENS